MIDFVIAGVGRSGSSLLHSMLACHSRISMPPETGFLRKAVFTLGRSRPVTAKEAVLKWPRLLRVLSDKTVASPFLYESELQLYIRIIEEYRAAGNRNSLVSTADDNASTEGGILSGDKDPKLIEYSCLLRHYFPSLKRIHIIRDPRDVLLSKKRAAWSAGRPVIAHLFAGYVQMKLGEQDEGRRRQTGAKESDMGNEGPLGAADPQHLRIRYEDLIKQPGDTLKTVCRFLDIAYEPAMLSFQGQARKLIAEEEFSWKKETTGPLLDRNSGKWITELTPFETGLTEWVCSQAMTLGGYKKSERKYPLPVLDHIRIAVISGGIKAAGTFYISWKRITQRISIRLNKARA